MNKMKWIKEIIGKEAEKAGFTDEGSYRDGYVRGYGFSCIHEEEVYRDDIDFKLDDKDMKKFSSQGQKRTAVLSLKLAELELLKEITGRKPIFLLDDVFSELDDKRQKAFLGEINNVQTFISCVDIDSFKYNKNNSTLFEIKNGSIVL